VTTSGFEAIFEARDPLPGIDLMAGPYTVAEQIVRLAPGREVRVRTYFHAELSGLAASYLESAAEYLKRYDALIGAYAFASYSIVSSPLPTGFGMPGIAYLGRQVIRLPFIRTTSLGHEVLHDWWGNGVYPDYAHGNWSEGLTTLLADYAFREDEGDAQARSMRIAWLRDFAAVRSEHDRPLAAFVARRHGADQAVGYNKTAFVFFMLRELIGEEHFRAGLRRFWEAHRFRVASWNDLRRAFEAGAGHDLSAFFTQWTSRAGAPSIEIASARRTAAGDRHRLVVELRQAGTPYQLNVPLRVYVDGGASFDTLARIGDAHARITVDLPARAQSLVLDPDTRVFRRLAREEIAPILREITLDRRTALVAAGSDAVTRETAQALARALLEHSPADWKGASIDSAPPLLVIGLHVDVADFLARHGLPRMPEALQARGTALAYARRGPAANAYVVVSARDPGALGAIVRALPHLGAQSFVAFEGARSIERGVWPMEPRRYMVTD
jgi:aminopeptidase N